MARNFFTPALFALALLSFSPQESITQVVMNEAAVTNDLLYPDEDGDYPDWIELLNDSDEPLNIAAWSLTDNELNWNKWQLPDITLAPGEKRIVFASGKNRNAFGPGPLPITDHWETAVFETDSWEYFIGTSEPAATWKTDITNATGWSNGQGGFGYGDGDDNTSVPAGTISVYFRKTFSITNTSDLVEAILSIDYDDGFIAYLNGIEIGRNGLSGFADNTTVSEIDHEAAMYSGGDPETFGLNNEAMQAAIINGINVLAIEIHNVGASSSDLSGRAWLHFGIGSTSNYFSANPSWFNGAVGNSSAEMHTNFKLGFGETLQLYNSTGELQDNILLNIEPGHTRARIPDGGSWCYSNNPTPGANNTGTCYSGYTASPIVFPASGFYPSSVSVSMSGASVRYTLDGDVPSNVDPLYTASVPVSATKVVRARAFQSGKLPSATVTRTYFIGDPTTLPVVSLVAHSGDLFNDGTGGPGVYDNSTGFNQAATVGGTVQYFDASHVFRFESNSSITPVGNWSLDFAQKSLQFKYDEEYGATGDIAYNIFSSDKPWLGLSHGFRVRNTDDDWGPPYGTGARMRDLIANRMALSTFSGTAGYQNVAVFINGEYWGHYAAREMLNTSFMKDNYGANPDSVDIVKTAYPGMDYVAENGSTDNFFAMSDFIINNDMSVQANFVQALTMIDAENWVDYWADEVYNNNADWFPSYWFNNTRMASSLSDNIKWKYVLWDVGYSQGNYGNVSDDLLSQALSYPSYPNRHTDMMVSLLENPGFRNYFINRFADLLNWHWTTNNVHDIIDDCSAEMAPEINRQNDRWGSGDLAIWTDYVNGLKDFHTERPVYQRDHIQNYFGLTSQVDITLQVAPAGAGYVKISTVIPDNYPWTGTYYNGNPVQVTAIANPGFQFVNWSSNAFISNTGNPTFNNNITTNTTFTANFTGTAVTPQIVVTEINYNSDSSRPEGDWIELYNASAVAIDLSDWIFKDQNAYNTFTIPTGTTIEPGAYLVLCDDATSFLTEHPGVTNFIGEFDFDLANGGETISMTSLSGVTIFSFAYDDANPWPCTPDGHGRTLELVSLSANPSLPASWFDGCMGGSPGGAYQPCIQTPLISEINYKSSLLTNSGDWIEIHNSNATAIDLGSWSIRDVNGNSFVFPSGTSIIPGGYLVVYEDSALFFAQFAGLGNAVGPMTFGFNGDGDVIKIFDAEGRLFISVCFNDTAPWPLTPDGGGYTLELLDTGDNVNDGNNWFAGCLGGSPGMAYDPACPVPCQNYGCTDPAACNFISAEYCEDGSCIYPGCINSLACNYDALAGCDNGTCTFAGCMDTFACNYNPIAGCSDNSCTYITYYYDLDNDTYGDPLVTGQFCNTPLPHFVNNNLDCDDNNANVYPGAPPTGENIDNNCNGIIDPLENADCPGDFNNDGIINTADLLLFIAGFGCSSGCIADLNGDDVVNTSDLLLFIAVFGNLCPGS